MLFVVVLVLEITVMTPVAAVVVIHASVFAVPMAGVELLTVMTRLHPMCA
jgi:hypothetical protein